MRKMAIRDALELSVQQIDVADPLSDRVGGWIISYLYRGKDDLDECSFGEPEGFRCFRA